MSVTAVEVAQLALPHRVEQRAVVHQAEEFIGRGHVVGDRLLAVVEESVGRPDLAGQEVVQRENLHGPVKLQPLVPPALTEEHVDGVLLRGRTEAQVNRDTQVGAVQVAWLTSQC